MIEASKSKSGLRHQTVVVVHGFGGKRIWMLPLCWRLKTRGYNVVNWSYPSFTGTLEKHAVNFRNFLAKLEKDNLPLHIVAHSMGSIVVRSAISKRNEDGIGRVVLLAPPNSGTPVARKAARILGWVCKPIENLSDEKNSYVNQLPNNDDLEIAVIAARFDILVPVANTHLFRQTEHTVLNATHNSLLISRKAADLASQFLTTGRFQD